VAKITKKESEAVTDFLRNEQLDRFKEEINKITDEVFEQTKSSFQDAVDAEFESGDPIPAILDSEPTIDIHKEFLRSQIYLEDIARYEAQIQQKIETTTKSLITTWVENLDITQSTWQAIIEYILSYGDKLDKNYHKTYLPAITKTEIEIEAIQQVIDCRKEDYNLIKNKNI